MNIINTETEYLILDAELANPTPDRRTSHDWTKAEYYPAGIYKLVTDTYEIDMDGTVIKNRDRYITTVGTLDGQRCRAATRLRERGDTAGEFEVLHHNLRGLGLNDRRPLYIRTLLDQHSLEDSDLVEILGRVMVATEFPLGKLDAIMSDYLLELIEADKEVN